MTTRVTASQWPSQKTLDHMDAQILRRAARILRERLKRKRSVVLAAICGVLTTLADKIDRGEA